MYGKIAKPGIRSKFVKIIDIDQGTDAWLELRRGCVTASELPIIMGCSPWRTPLQLWREKVGLGARQEYNSSMAYGNDVELLVRQKYPEYRPVVAVHSEHSWALASLDGWDGERVLEIKAANREDHDSARHGLVPYKYMPQLSWQLFVTGAQEVVYASYYRGDIAEVRFARNEKYISECFVTAEMFWRAVIDLEPPEASERDYVQINDMDALLAAEKWKAAKLALNEAEEKERTLRERVLDFTDDGNCAIGDVRVCRVNRAGSVDWNKVWCAIEEMVPEVGSVIDPAKYRKPSSGYWKLTISR